ncbi:MAG: chemotaxis protein CheW [Parvularcula sp.]|jgi:purine-binding chemotaxis protein CheW|nr:chemotaxis protein CheW [Parvularcula sp.]
MQAEAGLEEWPLFEEEGAAEAEAAAKTDSTAYLAFDLAGQTLAVPVIGVREIIDRRTMTRLPGAPQDVAGLVDLRGTSVPIIDIDKKLGVPSRNRTAEARTIVFDFPQAPDPFVVGIDADRVRSVLSIRKTEIERVPQAGLGSWDASLLNGIYRTADAVVVLLDLLELFDPQTVRVK